MKRLVAALAAWAALLALPAASPAEVRIKDITDLEGARSNQIFGFGLVVGLDGTGSRSTFTQQVAVEMLQRLRFTTGIFSQTPAESVIRSNSISAVMVTAEIGPFHRKGSRIDVQVSAMDDSQSLQGGTLLFTALRGADGEVYATAQGALSVGGFAVNGLVAQLQRNQVNVARIPNGGIVEKEALATFLVLGKARLLLKEPDFNTARIIAKAINERLPGTAVAQDAGAVLFCPPPDANKTPVQYIGEVGLCEVRPDSPARVVINERTGTVVAGDNVTLSTTAISHGNLFIVADTLVISPPPPFGGGITAVGPPRAPPGAAEQRNQQLVVIPRSTTVAEMARALNALGVAPRDLIAIFQALKQAGALHAELIIL